MPLPIVSPTLFNGHGFGATVGEPHVQAGNHIRVNTHPLLGLPVAPFVVWRGVATEDAAMRLRKDVQFRDRFGNPVQAPFTLTEGNPVTATLALAPNETCIWARVIADPIGSPRINPFGTVNPSAANDRRVADVGDVTGDVGRAFRRMDRGPLGIANARAGGMMAEAFVSTAHGPASVGRRNQVPYTFTAPGIVEIQLIGHAAVVGVEWLEASEIPHVSFDPVAVLNLPHEGGPRYASIVDAVKQAAGRVDNQAPKRRPLQETLGATAPPAAPLSTSAFERARVESLFKPLFDDLDFLVSDLSQSPFEQRVSLPVSDETGAVVGSADMSRLDRVFQGQFDPGVASFLGYMGYDPQFVEVENRIIFYWIDGYFRDFPSVPILGPAPPVTSDAQVFDSLLAGLSGQSRFDDVDDFVDHLSGSIDQIPNIQLNKVRLPSLEAHDDYIGLGTLVVVDRRAPLLPIAPPRIDRDSHVGWIPTVIPPDARRETRLDISGVVTGGLLAGEKRNATVGSAPKHLNKANDDDFHLPLVLGMNIDDETLEPLDEPGTGSFSDRDGAPVPIRYFLAQQDRFGRWSDWTSVLNQPGLRPRPPRPVLEAYYTQPADPAANPGRVRVRVGIPEPQALAPGAFLLERLVVSVTDLTAGTTVTHTRTSASFPAAPDPLDFNFDGPMLAPTERRQLRLTARWVDTAGQSSVDAEPVTLTLNDPRPPVQLTVPDELLYAGRPDVTGLAMIEHDWTPAPSQSTFGVYYSDENRLRAHLESVAAANPSSPEAGVLAALDAAPDPAARATHYRNNPQMFAGHLFERLDGAVMDTPSGGKRFRHAVSGSLRVLNFYRISAESASNAKVDLTTLPLIIFGVPNADPPAKPVVQVTPAAMTGNDDPYAVTVTIELTAAVTVGEKFRLRRSSLGASDVVRMPVVKTGVMPPVDEAGKQLTQTVDSGPVVISPTAVLKPWVRYHWIVEVQGAPAPGSGVGTIQLVPGLWGAASEPVSVILTPPAPPVPVTNLVATGVGFGTGIFNDVVLSFDHRHGLSGGAVGYYKARIQRRFPDDLMRTVTEAEVSGDAPYEVSGLDPADAGEDVPSGTLYRVVIVDPLGRESAPVDTVLT